jgi:hypothetical protein
VALLVSIPQVVYSSAKHRTSNCGSRPRLKTARKRASKAAINFSTSSYVCYFFVFFFKKIKIIFFFFAVRRVRKLATAFAKPFLKKHAVVNL